MKRLPVLIRFYEIDIMRFNALLKRVGILILELIPGHFIGRSAFECTIKHSLGH